MVLGTGGMLTIAGDYPTRTVQAKRRRRRGAPCRSRFIGDGCSRQGFRAPRAPIADESAPTHTAEGSLAGGLAGGNGADGGSHLIGYLADGPLVGLDEAAVGRAGRRAGP